MNYVQIMRKMIEEYGKKEFTHKDIINWTNTNCPHSVLKQLKKYYEIDYTWETSKNFKRFRKYTIIKRKDNNVQKLSVR